MINPEDIKAGLVLGHADAALLRDVIKRAEAAEAKLAELEKQKPVAWGIKSQLDWLDRHNYLQADLFSVQRFDEVPLFTRPAPAINLAELVPKEMAIYRGGNGSFNAGKEAGWNDCRAAMLRNIEEQSK